MPSPLYRVYQSQWGFSPTTLTAVYGAYIFVLLVTLVFCGSLSDYVGRRRMILVGLAVEALACSIFLIAQGVEMLLVARVLQGFAVGITSGAFGAALLDLRPRGGAAPLVSSATPTAGQAAGALTASALAQYAPAPTHLVWALLLAAFVLAAPAVVAMPEPGTRRRGALKSLRPHVTVPRQARGTFVIAVPGLVAVWGLGGFYLALAGSLAPPLLHSSNLLWGGILIFLLTGIGSVASVAYRNGQPSTLMLGGCLTLLAGASVTFAAITTRTGAILILGTVIAGLGFGPAFMGAYRSIAALAPAEERAGLVTAIFIVSYIAAGLPALIAGLATSRYGLHATALVYSLAIAGLAAAAAISSIPSTRRRHRAPHRTL